MLQAVNGVRLNVIDEGSGPPLVLVHGLGGGAGSRSWTASPTATG